MKGKGECPFNEKCFYLHAYPDGTIAKPKPRKRRYRMDADGESSFMDALNLWSFLENRDNAGDDGFDEEELSMFMSLILVQDVDDDFDDYLLYANSSDSNLDSDFDLWGYY